MRESMNHITRMEIYIKKDLRKTINGKENMMNTMKMVNLRSNVLKKMIKMKVSIENIMITENYIKMDLRKTINGKGNMRNSCKMDN